VSNFSTPDLHYRADNIFTKGYPQHPTKNFSHSCPDSNAFSRIGNIGPVFPGSFVSIKTGINEQPVLFRIGSQWKPASMSNRFFF